MAEKYFPLEQLQKWKEFYETNGYLIIPDFVTDKELDDMKDEAQNLISQFFTQTKDNDELAVFSTLRQQQKTSTYFIESGDKIRYFLEEDAVDDNGKLKMAKENAINKIGHSLHVDNKVFREFTAQEKISTVVEYLGLKNAVIPQSMVIFKPPKIGGYVGIHQDSTFMNTNPLSCMALWFPLEDVTLENAPLWVIPGSHKKGIVGHFKRNKEGDKVFMDSADPQQKAPWSSLEKEFDRENHPDLWVSLPCKKGSVVVIHGSIVHMSDKNRSPYSRHVYTFHMVDGATKWSPDNWLQYPEGQKFPSFKDIAQKN